MGNRTKVVDGIFRKKQGHAKYFCINCLKSGKGNPCGVQGHTSTRVDPRIRFPSYTASKTKWKEFSKLFGTRFLDEDEKDVYKETLKTLKGISLGS